MKNRMGKQVLTAFLCTALLCSCSGCGTLTGIVDKLGFDTYDYMSETVHTVHETDGEIAAKLSSMIRILTPTLAQFDSMREAIPLYRDAMLTFMLENEYGRYSGNMDLIEEASRAYPEYQITQIIPAAEFEATMYRYFGGTVKISHKDGSLFRYLKKVEAYISPSSPAPNTSEVQITSIGETDKTWQVTFTVSHGGITSEPYFVLIIKRDDGTLYFKQLKKLSEMTEKTEPAQTAETVPEEQ
ncbi:MAG: hypothetical protein IJB15_03105 [Clostridia bacterium]|nr:hypothetical protein [Clostridia bacterium]